MTEAVEARYREGLNNRWPSFFSTVKGAYWQNFQAAKASVLALRYWKEVAPRPVSTRRVEADRNHRGARVVWDDFAAFFTTRR